MSLSSLGKAPTIVALWTSDIVLVNVRLPPLESRCPQADPTTQIGLSLCEIDFSGQQALGYTCFWQAVFGLRASRES